MENFYIIRALILGWAKNVVCFEGVSDGKTIKEGAWMPAFDV